MVCIPLVASDAQHVAARLQDAQRCVLMDLRKYAADPARRFAGKSSLTPGIVKAVVAQATTEAAKERAIMWAHQLHKMDGPTTQ